MTASTRPTIADRVREYGIRMTWRKADRNAHMDPDGSQMDNYRCTLSVPLGHVYPRRVECMTLTYSKGVGLKGAPPTVEEVLGCLAMDCAGHANAGSFAAWCAEYGCAYDSRKEEACYRTVGRQRDSLARLIGADALKELMFETESL